MDYLKLLTHSFEQEKFNECPPCSRLEFLAESLFNFTTYDSDKSELFGRKAVEVCEAINERKTFEYIESDEGHTWFLIMCNMPFFAEKLSWGTSIRGAWWDSKQFKVESCGMWIEGEQCLCLEFTEVEWKKFIAAVVEFAKTACI